MAELRLSIDDITVVLPAVVCVLEYANYLNGEVPCSPPSSLTDSSRLAFYLYSAIKKCLINIKKKSKQRETLMFSSPFVKHLLGISYSPVTYSMLPGTSSDRHNSVWDSILGAKWDLISRCDVETSTIIRKLSFAENANFS